MDDQLRGLKRRIGETSRNSRGHRRYDHELRVAIVEYVLEREASGYSQAAIARELGLTQRTVWGWVRGMRGATLKPVEVVDDTVPEQSSGRTLVLAGGSRIEGLDLHDVIALVRALS